MKIFIICICLGVVLVSNLAYSYGEIKGPITSSGPSAFTLGVNYGVGLINPGDINAISNALGTSPSLPNINRSNFYGGFLGYRFLPAVELRLIYQVESATNMTSTTLGANTGFTLLQNEVFLAAEYYFFVSSMFYSYFGAGVGYPLYSHVTENVFVQSEFDADKNFGLMGQLGMGIFLGDHAGLFLNFAYEQIVTGIVRNNSGGSLLTPSSNSAVVDFSGPRVAGGLQFFF